MVKVWSSPAESSSTLNNIKLGPPIAMADPAREVIDRQLSRLSYESPLSRELPLYGYPELLGKRLALIDDSANVFGAFLPHLIAASGAEIETCLYRGQTLEELVQFTAKAKPDLVLIDWVLNIGANSVRPINGGLVTGALRKAFPNLTIVGFSSEPDYATRFVSLGANFGVTKSNRQAAQTVAELAAKLRNPK